MSVLLCASCGSASKTASNNSESTNIEIVKVEDNYSKTAMLEYSLNLVRNTCFAQDDNMIVSPYSAAVALAMLAEGAEGQTLAEINKALSNGKYSGHILPSDKNAKVMSSNSLWYRNTFGVRPSYIDNVKSAYNADVAGLDFNSPASVGIINNWCSEKTQGLIPEIIQEINPADVMYLINALYFKGAWDYFEEEDTYDDSFYGLSGKQEIPFMHSYGRLQYFENEKGILVRLPYNGRQYEMSIFLPKEGESLETVVGDLSIQDCKAMKEGLRYGKTELSLPKFKFESGMSLKPALQNMGMKKAFVKADLGAITDASVLVSDVYQKCIVDVSEKGTEAAAVTKISVALTSCPVYEPVKVINVNRPFMFVISGSNDGEVLFVGKVSDLQGKASSPSDPGLATRPRVKPGIEVLRDRNFDVLVGKKVGLVTNQSGVDSQLRSTIDILYNAPEVDLVALYGPEHGVRGNVWAGGKVSDSRDAATGLPIYSLYGATRKPTKEMLQGLDVVVYDIQDVGTRSYTFISTLGLVMQMCGEMGIDVVVLDRPNPLGGNKVEGSKVEEGFFSFVSQYPIPYIYGLTVGELAMMMNEEGLNRGQRGDEPHYRCHLSVIPMEGWTRDMLYHDTGLPWVMPSPNIPTADAALCYPASGICGELYDYLNIGIGFTLPFGLFGETWIDADALQAELTSYNIPGVAFRAAHWTPISGRLKGQNVQGVQFFYTDYDKAPVTMIQFYVMQAVQRLYPGHIPSAYGLFDKVCGSDSIRRDFFTSFQVSDIAPRWFKDCEDFRTLSEAYYLY